MNLKEDKLKSLKMIDSISICNEEFLKKILNNKMKYIWMLIGMSYR